MKKKFWIVPALLGVVLVVLYAFGYDQSDGQWVGDLKIGLVTTPSPPKVGQNTLRVTLRDRSGAPVTDARVVFYHFDVPPAYQTPQEYPVVETEGTPAGEGVYTVEAHLKKPGPYKVAVKVHGAGGRQSPDRPVTTAWFTLEVK